MCLGGFFSHTGCISVGDHSDWFHTQCQAHYKDETLSVIVAGSVVKTSTAPNFSDDSLMKFDSNNDLDGGGGVCGCVCGWLRGKGGGQNSQS